MTHLEDRHGASGEPGVMWRIPSSSRPGATRDQISMSTATYMRDRRPVSIAVFTRCDFFSRNTLECADLQEESSRNTVRMRVSPTHREADDLLVVVKPDTDLIEAYRSPSVASAKLAV